MTSATKTKTKGTGSSTSPCKSTSFFGDTCANRGDHTNRHSWDTSDYRRRRKAAVGEPKVGTSYSAAPAIYDPVADPVGAAKADAFLAKATASAPISVGVVEHAPVSTPKLSSAPEIIDVLISFDTTGSMQPCIAQVRREVDSLVQRLFKDIPQIRIGILTHGDYCDGPLCITKMDITNDQKKICDFIRSAPNTGGGDAPECYELVLHEARVYNWATVAQKVLVLIGDDVPHGPNEAQNKQRLDWRKELKALLTAGVHVYAVQALGRSHATSFYNEVAATTGGFHLALDQFSQIGDLIQAICFKQVGDEALMQYERAVECNGRMTRSMDRVFSTLLGREVSETYARPRMDGLVPVHPSRFQMLEVDKDDEIKSFVERNGATFKKGRGFYEFTKSVEVQDHKEVILRDNTTGDFFTGSETRRILGLPGYGTVTINPASIPELRDGKYTAFIQSTSVNRRLIAGTKFLYEVEDYAR